MILKKSLATLSCLFLILSHANVVSEQNKETIADRIKGSIFGGALGDAYGRPTEFIKNVDAIFKKYPHGIRSFADFKKEDFVNGIPVYTDDTAMTIPTLRVVHEAKKNNWDQERLMSTLAVSYIVDMDQTDGWAAAYRAPGNTCLANIKKFENTMILGKGWWQAGTAEQGGCGSVMHAHPFGLVYYDDPQKAASLAAEHSKITHGAPMALAACAAMGAGVAHAVQKKDASFIIKSMIQAARDYDEQTAQAMEKAHGYAQTLNAELDEIQSKIAIDRYFLLHEKKSRHVYEEFLGWDARSAIAATLYTFAIAHKYPQHAIYLGVHTPGDSDSIASMTGALVGAYNGYEKLVAGDHPGAHAWHHDVQILEGSKKLSELAREVAE